MLHGNGHVVLLGERYIKQEHIEVFWKPVVKKLGIILLNITIQKLTKE